MFKINHLIISDYEYLGRDSGTSAYVSAAHHTSSWLDHELNSKSSEHCLCGARGLIGLYHFIGVSILFHMPLIVSKYHDHNEIYGSEKRGGVQQKFAKISQC